MGFIKSGIFALDKMIGGFQSGSLVEYLSLPDTPNIESILNLLKITGKRALYFDVDRYLTKHHFDKYHLHNIDIMKPYYGEEIFSMMLDKMDEYDIFVIASIPNLPAKVEYSYNLVDIDDDELEEVVNRMINNRNLRSDMIKKGLSKVHKYIADKNKLFVLANQLRFRVTKKTMRKVRSGARLSPWLNQRIHIKYSKVEKDHRIFEYIQKETGKMCKVYWKKNENELCNWRSWISWNINSGNIIRGITSYEYDDHDYNASELKKIAKSKIKEYYGV